VREHAHSDILWVQPEKKSRRISVDQVRTLNQRLAQSSFGGGWKAGVLLDADRLNAESANAFLKTLEEPPGRAVLFLVTDAPQALLPTIVSRCQKVMLGEREPAPNAEWKTVIAEVFSHAPTGDPLLAGKLAERMNALVEAERERITEESAQEEEDVDKDVLDARLEARLRQTRSDIMRAALSWQRDVLVCASGGAADMLHYKEYEELLSEVADLRGWQGALDGVRSVETMARRLERNVPPIEVFEEGLTEAGLAK
jgi:DNA polymerase-3 subunit delta'